MEIKYPFNWEIAFRKAAHGRRGLLDEHMAKAREQILLPLLRAKSKSPQDAAEIASLVITKFWERFHTKEEPLPDNVNGYLYTMANNALFRYSKQKNKKRDQFVNLDIGEMNRIFDEHADDGGAEEQEQKELLLTALETSFKQLGDKCRNLLRMFIYEKKRMKDIHKVLGIASPNAATKKKESCINQLRKLMYKEIHEFKRKGYV